MVDAHEVLSQITAAYQGIKGGQRTIRRGDRLREDLGIDSLEAQELLFALEQDLGVVLIGNPGLADVRTVGQLIDAICSSPAPPPIGVQSPASLGDRTLWN